MEYRALGKTNLKLSVIGLGGHEFHPDGRVKGFGDDYKKAVTAGVVFAGFGGHKRVEIVKRALELGINVFDLTIDSEKEAMGRTLADLQPSQQLFIQTRPEGMGYSYDPENKKMVQYDLLRGEVLRILKMLGREKIDILNLPFMKSALDADPEYLEKTGENIRRLKREGLVTSVSCDTLSAKTASLAAIRSGHFDVVYTNYNITEPFMHDVILTEAVARNMGVLAREAFMKATLFSMASQAGIADRNAVARLAVKWLLRNTVVTSLMVGVSSIAQLENNAEAAGEPRLTHDEDDMLDRIRRTRLFNDELQKKKDRFFNDRQA